MKRRRLAAHALGSVLLAGATLCGGGLPVSALAAQQSLGEVFDRAFPAVVQVLVASPDSTRQGSGFAYGPDGAILTHLPLLDDAQTIFVRPSLDDAYYRAHLASADERHQIAVLEIENLSLPSLVLGRSDSMRVGSRVIALGSARERENPIARGIVRGRRPTEGTYALDVAAPIPPTMSGGPVLGEDGKVVGMVVSRIENGRSVNAAIPVSYVRDLLARRPVKGPIAQVASREADSGGDEGRPPLRDVAVSGAETAARSVVGEVVERPQAPRPEEPAEAAATKPTTRTEAARGFDLTGLWLVVNTIEDTSHPAFEGLELGFRIFLRQNGKRVVGEGWKWRENGREIPEAARSPIRLRGTLEGRTLVASFVEKGERRTVRGRFSWFISEDGSEVGGRFADEAARSSGTSQGRKVE